MNDRAELTGWIRLRPARIGLVFKPTLETLSLAARYVTSAWGGLYFPFLNPVEPTAALKLAEDLDVDALYPIDDAEESERLASEVGFRWRGRGHWGPFNYSDGRMPTHLLGTDWILDEATNANFVMPWWESSHPLDCLFSLWFGRYGDSPYESERQARFMRLAVPIEINVSGHMPAIGSSITPIGVTALEMEYTGSASGSGVVVLDPKNPDHLVRFWNLRATGAHVYPWISGSESRFGQAFGLWLDTSLNDGHFRSWKSGDGRDLGPHISVHLLGEEGDPPAYIVEELERRNFTVLPESGQPLPHGWNGTHPFSTQFEQIFTVSLSRRGLFSVPVPRLGGARWYRGHQPGIAAAEVNISSASGLSPEWTIGLPGVRRLAGLADGHAVGDMAQFHRSTWDGRVVGVRADAHEASITPVRSLDVLQELMGADSGWTLEQANGGRFATRLMEMLGGAASQVANQPGVRAVLTEAAGSVNGRPIPALIQSAKKYQGAWPSQLAARSNSDYPVNIVRMLIARKVLQAALPVRCPECTNETIVRPEDLRSAFVCELCEAEAPLGLALSLKARNEWLYRLAGNLPSARLSETLPVMASLSVLSTYRMSSGLAPYVLGLDVKAGRTPFEVDLMMALPESFPPLVVVGEVKSYRDSITADDLSHLISVQSRLRNRGVECYILVATLRPRFEEDEVAALRHICEALPTTLSRQVYPVMPIALTAENLSVPSFHEDHPMRWSQPGDGLANVAIESCKRNLGLISVEDQRGAEGWTWQCRWSDDS